MKPFKGRIHNWRKVPFDQEAFSKLYGEPCGLGYVIAGDTSGHPEFDGANWFRTSWVVYHDENGHIETRNSRYLLVGEERK